VFIFILIYLACTMIGGALLAWSDDHVYHGSSWLGRTLVSMAAMPIVAPVLVIVETQRRIEKWGKSRG